jgi:hypothetical protein
LRRISAAGLLLPASAKRADNLAPFNAAIEEIEIEHMKESWSAGALERRSAREAAR